MTEPNDVDARATRVEERVAHLEKTVEQLSDVVFRQGQQLDELRGELDRHRAHIQRLLDVALGDNLPHEKPPHY